MITLLGDVHGEYKRLHEVIRKNKIHEYIVQLGDFGFDYETLKNVDPKKFVIVGGNHENYDKIVNIPHYLGDFGQMVNFNGVDFFYYRGAYSIDKQDRTIGINYWQQEEVKIEAFLEAKKLYRQVKPDIVITHDAPEEISYLLLKNPARLYQNMTGYFLQELFNIHQPKFWYFGHHHKSWNMEVNGTFFQCLNILETKIIE